MNLFALLLIGLLQFSTAFADGFTSSQCKEYPITQGRDKDSDGILRYCDNGTDQRIYVSGEMDSDDQGPRTKASLLAAIKQFKKRSSGKFEIITRNAGGGDVDWHQAIAMAVEDSCTGSCKISTEVHGYCESACNQLHLICTTDSKTTVHPGGKTCEHATSNKDVCKKCDYNNPEKCDICGPKESMSEYTERCGKLLRNRKVKADSKRAKQIQQYVKGLASKRVFDTSTFSCHQMPWAETAPAAGSGTNSPAQLAR